MPNFLPEIWALLASWTLLLPKNAPEVIQNVIANYANAADRL